MRTIWKYPLAHGYQEVVMPEGATLLHVALQGDQITLWAEVTPEQPTQEVYIHVIGTDHVVLSGADYIGTVQQGRFVWHVYEDHP